MEKIIQIIIFKRNIIILLLSAYFDTAEFYTFSSSGSLIY